MSIHISQNLCIGCRKCIQVCPGSLIDMLDNGKAYLQYPKNCWGCASCVKECHSGAISFYLGADIGGQGSTMNVQQKDGLLYWNITAPSGSVRTIEINRHKSNTY